MCGGGVCKYPSRECVVPRGALQVLASPLNFSEIHLLASQNDAVNQDIKTRTILCCVLSSPHPSPQQLAHVLVLMQQCKMVTHHRAQDLRGELSAHARHSGGS